MSKTILLVEDDQILAEMYEEKLRLENYTVVLAKDGGEALKAARRAPDLILLDVMMPKMNGFEVLKALKANAKTQNIPVIVLTNIGSEHVDNDRNLALSLGAESYLVKSYHTPDEIIKRINNIIDNKKPRP